MAKTCPFCGAELKLVKEFNYYMCKNKFCDFDMNVGETYEDVYEKYYEPWEEDPGMDEGCVACGNPDYPKCRTSCRYADE